MKKVVSISLGSSKRDKLATVELLGQTYEVQRIGVDGNLEVFAQQFVAWDGVASAIGVGGADLYVFAKNRRYTFRQVHRLVSCAKISPVVDGSGLKNSLETRVVHHLQSRGVLDFRKEQTLLVSGVDRFGMASALDAIHATVRYGDLKFGLGIPIPITSFRTLNWLAKLLLPVITQLPIQWLYPTGAEQELRSPKFESEYRRATVIAGDWHFIRRFAPGNLIGKTVLTQTVRSNDIELLRSMGVSRLITTTPMIDGETFATNVMEALLVAHLNKNQDQIRPDEFFELLDAIGWGPSVLELNP
jgi:hypothetical protein